MKRSLRVFLAALLVAAFAAPAPAWELSLTGRFNWGYDYVGQTGSQGFFGPYDAAAPGLIIPVNPNYPNFNAWVGARTIDTVQYGIMCGADASLNWLRAEMEPEFRINNAIRVRGLYEIGSFNPYTTTAGAAAPMTAYGLYPNSTFFGTYAGFAVGKWNCLWATVQTPWGILALGKRPGPFGLGAQYEGTMAQSESLLIVAPYGPFRIGFYTYPQREMRWLPTSRDVISTTTAYPTVTEAGLPAAGTSAQSRLIWDKQNVRNLQPGAFVTYSSGPLEMGILYEWWSQETNPGEGATQLGAVSMPKVNGTAEDGSAFAKYNNGRFFFNAELAWFRAQSTCQLPQTPLAGVTPLADPGDGGGSYYAPRYLESWKGLLELGGFCGPGKLSFLVSWVPGPDRRNGIWIHNQSWENVAGGAFLGNTQVFLPYSLLMSYQYGGGLNALNQRGEGFMTDAISYGARLDYAVAANLNVSASFFYANRLSHGWGWGSLTMTQAGAAPFNRAAQLLGGFGSTPATTLNIFAAGVPGVAAPSIPDNNLGWEATAGVDWKILEGVTINMRAAYWQPGKWFVYACPDKGFLSTVHYTPAVVGPPAVPAVPQVPILPVAGDGPWGWGINPGRNIDPIVMFQGVMTIDF